MNTVHLQLRDISKYYISGREVTAALNSVNLTFSTGEFIAITGESGSGKSTLSHILAGILPFERGELLINGQSTFQYSEENWEQYRLEQVSFIAQNYGILPGSTVLENVVSVLRLIGMEPKAARAQAEKLLRQVELWKFRKRRAARLSSGQKQRLSIARALAKPAPILIADEPTSNLDRANSRKIIQLLSEAGRERLVIMVTHDFDTVKEFVTRQIMLHDGTLESDTVLRERPASFSADSILPKDSSLDVPNDAKADSKPSDMENSILQPAYSKRNQPRLGWYIARLLLYARPAWTLFMAAFFTLTAFAVFAFLGTFIISLDDTSTRIYNNEAFRNGDNTRIVVAKPDHTPLTDEDYAALLSVTWVDSLERWDAVSDINYYYREGIDYTYRYSVEMGDMFSAAQYNESVFLVNDFNYIRTIPLFKSENSFLTAGALPEHMNEVVAAGSPDLIGTTIPVYFLDRKNWGADSYIYQNMTVVGVTDYGSGLYFDERIGKMLNQYISSGSDNNGIIYGINYKLEENQIAATESFMNKWLDYYLEIPDTISCPNMNQPDESADLQFWGKNLSFYPKYFEITEKSFDELNLQESCIQASLYLRDYSYTDRAIRAIRKLGYEAISPYRVSSVTQDTGRANARLTTLVLCMLALITVIAAQILVLSAMFGLEMKNYTQLSDLGLSWHVGQYSVCWQILLLTLIGQVLGFSIILFGARSGVQRLFDVLKYLTPLHILAICLLHLAASLLVALTVCRMLRRRVFPFIRRSFDIDLAELEEKEVAVQ